MSMKVDGKRTRCRILVSLTLGIEIYTMREIGLRVRDKDLASKFILMGASAKVSGFRINCMVKEHALLKTARLSFKAILITMSFKSEKEENTFH